MKKALALLVASALIGAWAFSTMYRRRCFDGRCYGADQDLVFLVLFCAVLTATFVVVGCLAFILWSLWDKAKNG